MLFLSPSLQLSCRCFCCHGLPCCYHCSFVAALKGSSNTTKTNKTLLCACKLPQTTLTCFVPVYKAQKEKVSYPEQTEPSQATMTSSSPSSWCSSQLYDATAFVRSLRPRVQLLPEHYYSPECRWLWRCQAYMWLYSSGVNRDAIYRNLHHPALHWMYRSFLTPVRFSLPPFLSSCPYYKYDKTKWNSFENLWARNGAVYFKTGIHLVQWV